MRIDALTLLVDVLAVFRLAVFIAEDAFPPVAWLREKILARWPSEDTLFHESEVTLADGTRVGSLFSGIAHGHQVEQVERGSEFFYPLEPSKWSKLLTCIWCLSIWLAIIPVAGHEWFPQGWTVAAMILALSAAASLLNQLRS